MLVAAFALSVLLHVFVALLVHPPRPSLEHESVPYGERTVILHMTPPPRTPPHKPRVTPPRVVSALPQPSAPVVTPSFVPTPPPTPASVAQTPGSRCVSPDVPAALAETPPPQQIPPSVRALAVSGTAAVEVQVSADGSVTGATIAATSGDPTFDAFALSMARAAQYAPARRACKEVASSYLFRVQFAPW